MIWLALLIVVFLAAASLTLLGLRGRRADDHPLCRRCGFDLTGNPDAAVCNECGADLTRPRATKVGHRARRKGPLVAGLALLVPCLLVGGLVGYVVIRGIDVQAYKPAWLLARELRSGDAPTRDAAFAELDKRLAAGDLSAAATGDTTAWVLDVQGDAAAKWDTKWGDLIESARAAGKLGDEPWRRYARQGLVPELTVRPDIRQGDPLPMQVGVERRTGRRQGWQMWITVDGVRAGGAAVEGEQGLAGGPRGSWAGGIGYTAQGGTASGFNQDEVMPGRQTDALPLGPARLTAQIELVIGEYSPTGGGYSSPNSLDSVPELTRQTYQPSAAFAVRGRDEPANWTVDDESLRGGVESSVQVTPLRPWDSSGGNVAVGSTQPAEQRWVIGVRSQTAGKPKVALKYYLVFRRGGREAVRRVDSSMSRGTVNPNGTRNAILAYAVDGDDVMTGDAGDAEASEPLTLILRPDLEAIARQVDPTPVWGKDIVFEDVPLERAPTVSPMIGWQIGPWHGVDGSVDAAEADRLGRPTATGPTTAAASQPASP